MATAILRGMGVVCDKCSEINRLYSTEQIIFDGHGRMTQACRKCGKTISVYVDFRR
jgi:hypothetical protein